MLPLLLLACSPDPVPPVRIPNAAPVIQRLAWRTPAVRTASVLSVDVAFSDAEGDPVALSYAWMVNGLTVPGNGPSLDGTLRFERGDQIAVTVTPADPTGQGLPATLDGMSVDNTLPDAPQLAISPDDPVRGLHDLVCQVVADSSDADGDACGYQYAWLAQGETLHEGALLPAELTDQAEIWVCSVTPHDGLDEGQPARRAVEPRPPEVSDLDPWVQPHVFVTPHDAQPGDVVTVRYEGALADSEGVTMRYGWNGWVDLPRTKGLVGAPDPYGTDLFYAQAAMTADGSGHSLDLTLPQGARSLHMVFLADDRPGELDDNEGLEYHHALVFPYIGPFLTWNDQARPANGVVVSFETSEPCLGVIALGTGEEPLRLIAGQAQDSLHHFELSDLEPDTEYFYQVHSSAGRSSEVFSFRTAPAQSDSLEFVVLADVQDNGAENDRWPSVAQAILQERGDAAFVLAVGDLAADDRPGWWWRFFDGGRDLFASVPLLPVVGNHDTPFSASNSDVTSFTRYFDLPQAWGSEVCYAQDYGPARFLLLSSETPEEFEVGGVQRDWLEQELLATWDGTERVVEWVFAAWHHPPYDIGGRFAKDQSTYRPITELCDGYVDWVFTGHEHIYQRFAPVRYEAQAAGAYGIGPEDGVGYLVTPAAGDSLWSYLVNPESPDADARPLLSFPELDEEVTETDVEHGFLTVSIDGPSIVIESWGMGDSEQPMDPWLRDSVSYSH